MALYTFSLRVPFDHRFESIGPDVSSRFLEVAGGSHQDAVALRAEVARAMRTLAPSTGDYELSFESGTSTIVVTIRRGERSTVVTHPLSAPKPLA